jgi:outer membrane protein TolC
MKSAFRILVMAGLGVALMAPSAAAQEPPPAQAPEPVQVPEPLPPSEQADRPALELSLDDVVQRALENNLTIIVEKYNPEDAAEAVREVKGVYDPSQYVPTGGRLQLDFNNSRVGTNSVFFTVNPRFDSSLNLRLVQPLLRDLSIDRNRQQIIVAKRNREISDVEFRQVVINTVAGAKQLYYDLIFALDNLEAQRKSLALAKKLLDENQIKVRVGTMAPLDVVAAESEVAGREEGVITAEASVMDAEDALKRTIFPAHDTEMWRMRLLPKERPTAEPVTVDIEQAIANALANRTDIVSSKKNIENLETTLKLAKNQTLPTLDLQAGYGAVGIGGTTVLDENGNPLVPPIEGGWNDAVSSVFGTDFPTWTLGVQFGFPIPNRTAGAGAARARIARDQALASLRRLELVVATDVRSAGRAVETNFKRVASTRAARVLQERRLDAEEKRFAAGMSTNFLVTQAQRDLALAEVNELRAIADYRKSVVNFERVQEAGGGVLFSVATSSGGISEPSGFLTAGQTATQ